MNIIIPLDASVKENKMGKNKKRKKKYVPPVENKKELPPWAEGMKPPKDLSPEQRAMAVGRLKGLLTALSAPGETVLEMLDRLEIPWERVENVVGHPEYDTLVVRFADIEEGEKKNEPFIKRVYKDNTEIPAEEPEEPYGYAEVTEPVEVEVVEPEMDLTETEKEANLQAALVKGDNLYAQTPEQTSAVNQFIETGE